MRATVTPLTERGGIVTLPSGSRDRHRASYGWRPARPPTLTLAHEAPVSDSSAHAPPRDALTRLHDEVAARLRPVCRDIPDDRFDALVREVVRVRLKYDPLPDRTR